MAVRTDVNKVKGVLMRDWTPGNDVTPFIDTASVMYVDRIAEKDPTLAANKLELIERWLAAHFYVMSDQALKQKMTDRAMAIYQGNVGNGLRGSKYGTAAIDMDPTGLLATIADEQARVVATMMHLGDPEDYE